MKVECPVCGVVGVLQKRATSLRVQHYVGFSGGKRRYRYHSFSKDLLPELRPEPSKSEGFGRENLEVNSVNLDSKSGIVARDVGFEPTRPFDHRLSRLSQNDWHNGKLSLVSDLSLENKSFTSSGLLPIEDFKTFCMIDLQQVEATAKEHRAKIRRFLNWLDGRELSQSVIREYLMLFITKSVYTYANQLKSLKVYCRDYLRKPLLVETFKFPQIPFEPKEIPTKKQLRIFYNALEGLKDKALFLVYATSGLRRQEALHLFITELDFKTCMIKPKQHNGRTKHTWVTFFNAECTVVLKQYLTSRTDKSPKLFPMSRVIEEKLWHYAVAKTGIRITPQMLREWFSEEMGNRDVPDRYIDALAGRLPKSVLAKHYSDYSPKKLLKVYRKARLKLFP